MGNDTRSDAKNQQSLFRDRKERFQDLRLAVDRVADVTEAQRANLISLIEKLEVKTLKDGFCYLTREELAAALHWSKSKFDNVRRLAEELRWIEVARNARSRGGQGANNWKVNWNRIAAHARVFFDKSSEEAPLTNEEAPPKVCEAPLKVCDPITEEFIPSKIQSKNPIHHEADGLCKDFGGWDEPIERSQMTHADWVLKRYHEAIRKGWIVRSDISQVQFFALSAYCKRKGKINPGGYFTTLLRKSQFIYTKDDERGARKIIEALRGPAGATPDLPVPSLGIPKSDDPHKSEQLRKLAERYGSAKETDDV